MRILLYENPKNHVTYAINKERSIKPWIEIAIKSLEFDFAGTVENLYQAEQELKKGNIELVIFHHFHFSEVNHLKKRYPNVKYAASSEHLSEDSLGLNKIFLQHYDHLLLGWYDEEIEKIAKEIRGERK